MPLEPGTQVGSYQITARIGAGGMGEVYRATDRQLEREVAIKVLPHDVARDSERLSRFEREAKVLASLNHPSIGHIYGLVDADGTKALVLELVEGPTLAERIEQGPIPVEEALPIARQISEALEAAHGRGVVHRDLKPANVKVRPDGAVKVLDFGLAKAAPPEVGDSDPEASPTLTAATQVGVILGTAAYMSPEQARGRPVDKRADIWAFGVVLFEMLSGRRPFAGEDVSGTLARVIEREPDWTVLPSRLPPALRAFLHRCLAKEPGQRIHDIADMRLAIEGAFDAALPFPSPSATRLPAWQRPTAVALIVLGAAAVTAVLTWYAKPRPEDGGVVHSAIPAPEGVSFSTSVETHDMALSPDGRRLAFAAATDDARRLWLQSLEEDTAEPLKGTENAFSPFWSPDGQWLAFFTPLQLWKLRPGTGPPEVVCRAQGAKTGAWGADGTILFTQQFSKHDGLYRVAATGGEPQLMVEDGPGGQSGQRWPVFLPDGKRFLYNAFPDSAGAMELFAGSISSEETHAVYRLDSRVAVAAGHLVYVEQGNLLARPFDVRQLRFTGDAVLLGTGLPQFVTAWAPFTVSEEGVIAYGRRSGMGRLSWRDRRGRELRSVGEPGLYKSVALSPDGSRLAIEIEDGAERDIWIHDLERDVRTRFTSEAGMDSQPVWSPDGDRIVYTRHGPRARNGLNVRTVAGGEPTALNPDALSGLLWTSDWSLDGRWIVYEDATTETGGDLWLYPMNENGSPVPRFRTRFNEAEGAFSPDSQWIAYSSDESGRFEIYVAAVTGTDRGVRVSTDGGYSPRWRRDGKELFYQSAGGIAVVPMQYPRGEPVPGPPRQLFPTEGQLVDVTSDGERFLVGESTDRYSVRMILNWKSQLEKSN